MSSNISMCKRFNDNFYEDKRVKLCIFWREN
jgi:hypothetical protein